MNRSAALVALVRPAAPGLVAVQLVVEAQLTAPVAAAAPNFNLHGPREAAARHLTSSVAVVVRVRMPLIPVIVNRYDPAGVAGMVVMVNAEEAPAAGFGL